MTSTVLVGSTTAATAQDAAPPAVSSADQAPAETTAIVVTGSRLSNPALAQAAPLTVVSAKEIAQTGKIAVEDILNEYPQLIPSTSGASNNPGGGEANVDLRGIGAERTLVLVNGRRWIPADTTQVVDVNTIPAPLLERVDIVTGGRSAVYGSDAIAGVVNFVTKQDFEGVQGNASYRLNQAGDGGTGEISLMLGHNFAEGRANITLYGDYTRRKSVLQADRSYTRQTYTDDGAGGLTAGGSGTTPAGRFSIDGTSYKFTDGGGYSAYTGADAYNYAPENYLQVPLKRKALYGQAHFDANDHLKFYGEGSYIDTRVENQLAPTPFTGAVTVQTNSPYLSAATQSLLASTDTDGDGYTTLNLYRRMNEVGDRISSDNDQSWRALGGVKGQITGDWNYDAYFSYSHTRAVETQYGNISSSRLQQALDTTFDSSGSLVCVDQSNGCVPANVFGAGTLSAAAVKFISITTRNESDVTEEVADASITNDRLFDLGWGGGYAGLAFGFEWRREHGSYDPDAELASGDVVGFNASDPVAGGYNVKEEFIEMDVPLLGNRPFIDKLALTGAFRHSDYSSNAGSVNTFSVGGVYAPVRDISFRAQYSTAVRNPTIDDLYAGASQGYYDATDPCTTSVAKTNSSLAAQCVATGVSASLLGTAYDGGNAQIEGYSGGNSALKAEKSRTLTIGTVIQPRFLPRFSLTVDFYRINVDNYITTVGVPNLLRACYGDASNGYTPYDTSYCAALKRGSDDVIVATDTLENSGGLKTKGVDFEARYAQPLNFGIMGAETSSLDFRLSGTRLIGWSVNPLVSVPDLVVNCVGKFGLNCGNPYSKWRLNTRVTWNTGPLSLSLAWRHLSSVRDDDDTTVYSVEKIPAYNYYDMTASFDVMHKFTWTLGINNLADKKPPILGDNQEQSNTYPSTYDVYGRAFFTSVSFKY
jgi:outer membrane receptor protein involved in Fe transport